MPQGYEGLSPVLEMFIAYKKTKAQHRHNTLKEIRDYIEKGVFEDLEDLKETLPEKEYQSWEEER